VHERLARDALAAGATYKISGAGGGDFGIALACSADGIDRLQAIWTGAGFLTLPLGPGVPGATLA
jgi:mevalonate kinase